ncbi:hypothetical protein [Microbacterium aerolatum]|uniref:hypothetical protein n=1 Tax=Microbacterium aerolatum TaxID=153731 RepID=UPI00384F1B9F
MNKRLAPVVAFAVTAGALTYLFSGAWAVAAAWVSDREAVTEHKSIYSQYWTEPAWTIGAFLVACTVLAVTLSDSRNAVGSWKRWPLWGLLPGGVYILTLAALVPIFRGGQPSDAMYVALWATIDGSLWMALLAPIIARAIVCKIGPWKVHFEYLSPEPSGNDDDL